MGDLGLLFLSGGVGGELSGVVDVLVPSVVGGLVVRGELRAVERLALPERGPERRLGSGRVVLLVLATELGRVSDFEVLAEGIGVQVLVEVFEIPPLREGLAEALLRLLAVDLCSAEDTRGELAVELAVPQLQVLHQLLQLLPLFVGPLHHLLQLPVLLLQHAHLHAPPLCALPLFAHLQL